MSDDIHHATYAPAVKNGGAALGATVAYATPVQVSLRKDLHGMTLLTEGGKLTVSQIARIDKLYGHMNTIHHQLVLDNGDCVPASEAIRVGT